MKIKQNINLKDLGKMGYDYLEGEYTKSVSYIKTTGGAFYETIFINEKDRVIRTRLYNDLSNQEWEGITTNENRCVQDLAKANMIEY